MASIATSFWMAKLPSPDESGGIVVFARQQLRYTLLVRKDFGALVGEEMNTIHKLYRTVTCSVQDHFCSPQAAWYVCHRTSCPG